MLSALTEKLDSLDLNKVDYLFREYYFDFGLPSSKFVAFLLNQTGKKLRPLLLLLSARIAGDINENSYKYATIFEALHTASLIHDDIIDLAELRRGENSMNQQFGNKLAVLTGDFILSRSLSILAQEQNPEILRVYATASEELCLGEIQEQQIKSSGKITLDKYFEVLRLKTASLFSACCEAGVLSTQGPENIRQILRAFGENLGIAFQIKDDLLDFTGNVGETGKDTGKDIAGNIITYPILSVVNDLPKHLQKEFSHYSFSEMKKLITDYSGFKKTEDEILKYSSICLNILDRLESTDKVEVLKKIVKLNIDRKF
ncbi:MAG: polyprenyl synthetase family protein [Candidatus Marinimicrobia bacterium]|nr:polyprenyl synthetase family protein [Candidatus Neomarinimicrobiota bacterium]